MTEAAFVSWTSIRTVSLSLYRVLSRRMSPNPRSMSATATRANGCGPTGTFAPSTWRVHVPTPGLLTMTPSIGFRVSKLPLFGRDSPRAKAEKTFPLYTLPFGAVTWRFRLFTRDGFEFGKAG